jgi:hypothetical protein
MTTRLEPVAWRLRRAGAALWNLWDLDPRTETPAYADETEWELQPLYAAAPAPDGMRGAIVAAVSANVSVNDGQTVINGPAIANAILAIIAKGGGG